MVPELGAKPARGHSAMSGAFPVVTRKERYWHAEGTGQGFCQTSNKAQDSPTTKNDPAPDVRRAEAEKPYKQQALKKYLY